MRQLLKHQQLGLKPVARFSMEPAITYEPDGTIESIVFSDDITGAPLEIAESLQAYGYSPLNAFGSGTSAATRGGGNYQCEPPIQPKQFSNGITLEALTSLEPSGNLITVVEAFKQARMRVKGPEVIFELWTGAGPTLTTLFAPFALGGKPQLIQCCYDPAHTLQTIWVDGRLVASGSASGEVPVSLNAEGRAFLEVGILEPPASVTTAFLVAQDIAVYPKPLSIHQIERNYRAFRQIDSDPGHVALFP